MLVCKNVSFVLTRFVCKNISFMFDLVALRLRVSSPRPVPTFDLAPWGKITSLGLNHNLGSMFRVWTSRTHVQGLRMGVAGR